MGQSLKWAAQLDNVSEVSLTGTADFDYWKNHLATQGYVPVKTDDRASIAVVSASGKFAGVRFQELSISVSVSAPNGGMGLPSFFLVQAFSSNRFFAFCERALFSTPYQFANVTVDYPEPTGVRVLQKGQVCLEASMALNPLAHQRSRVERRYLWIVNCGFMKTSFFQSSISKPSSQDVLRANLWKHSDLSFSSWDRSNQDSGALWLWCD